MFAIDEIDLSFDNQLPIYGAGYFGVKQPPLAGKVAVCLSGNERGAQNIRRMSNSGRLALLHLATATFDVVVMKYHVRPLMAVRAAAFDSRTCFRHSKWSGHRFWPMPDFDNYWFRSGLKYPPKDNSYSLPPERMTLIGRRSCCWRMNPVSALDAVLVPSLDAVLLFRLDSFLFLDAVLALVTRLSTQLVSLSALVTTSHSLATTRSTHAATSHATSCMGCARRYSHQQRKNTYYKSSCFHHLLLFNE